MWDTDDIERLKRLWLRGHSAGEIADKLGCSRSAVGAKLKRMGLRRARTSKPVILTARKIPTKRSRPVQSSKNRKGNPSVALTKEELYAMLARAVKNTR